MFALDQGRENQAHQRGTYERANWADRSAILADELDAEDPLANRITQQSSDHTDLDEEHADRNKRVRVARSDERRPSDRSRTEQCDEPVDEERPDTAGPASNSHAASLPSRQFAH